MSIIKVKIILHIIVKINRIQIKFPEVEFLGTTNLLLIIIWTGKNLH